MADQKILHVFENDVPEWMIAYDPQDAIKVWEETTRMEYSLVNDEGGGEFIQCQDEQEFTLYEDETIDREKVPAGAVYLEQTEFSHRLRATCRAWADARGRCYLGSSEY